METTVPLSLSTVCGGCAEERFNFELQKILENILDPNTDATAERSVTLTVKIKPDEDRNMMRNTLTVSCKPAPLSPQSSVSLIGKDVRGKAEAHEVKPFVQAEFEFPENVTKLKKEGK